MLEASVVVEICFRREIRTAALSRVSPFFCSRSMR
jgi:hypothetical protein